MADPLPLPARADVESFLAAFPELDVPVRLSSDRRDAMLAALHGAGLVVPFEWGPWADEAAALLRDPVRLQQCDAEAACRIVTVLVRTDRFAAGEIDAALGDGRFASLFRLIRSLCSVWPAANRA